MIGLIESYSLFRNLFKSLLNSFPFMGRIRTSEIKNITKLVIEKYTLSSFSDDFEKNKEILKSFPEEFPSKKVLNKIAGYITFKYKKEREAEKRLLEPSGEREQSL